MRVRGAVAAGISCLAVCALLVGCGGGTKTVTETVEVEYRTTYGQASGGAPVSDVMKFCSSPEGEEIDAIAAEARQALERPQDGALVDAVRQMVAIAEDAPPGARCVFAQIDPAKLLLSEHPELIRLISQVEQERELTEADVERIEREG